MVVEIAPFGGECSQNEIDRLVASRRLRSVAQFSVSVAEKPRYCQSTGTFHGCSGSDRTDFASTDAPCSALSVIYTDDGELTAI